MRLIHIIVLAAFLLLTFPTFNHALAQIDPKSPAQTCIPLNIIRETSKIMEQRQIMRGLNQRQELIIITANPFTEKWTAWQSVQGQYLCVVAFGTIFTLVDDSGETQ